MADDSLSRRNFLAFSGVGLLSTALARHDSLRTVRQAPAAPDRYPIGLELYSVRAELAKDLPNTLRSVAQAGYQAVEFYAPYLAWTLPYAKDVRTILDDNGLRCYSTHNSFEAVTSPDKLGKSIELNQILGARHLIVASPPANTDTLEEWKRACGELSASVEQLAPHGLYTGFHNHRIEWTPLARGTRVMDVIAANTPREFILQLDVGTCMEAGADPVAWITANPGRIRSVHLKDWAPGSEAAEKGYRVLFGEGVTPWKQILAAVESVGGVEFYLMEQEGSRYSALETARRCLATWRTMRSA